MNTFGKSGIGNESTYNAGYKFCRFIALSYGADKLKEIVLALSSPLQFSVSSAIEKSIGISGNELYDLYKKSLENGYDLLTQSIRSTEVQGRIIAGKGTANLHPVWSPNGKHIAYLSNEENDFFGQTDLFIHDLEANSAENIQSGVVSAPTWNNNGSTLYYAKKAK